jgi:hypothetical protein
MGRQGGIAVDDARARIIVADSLENKVVILDFQGARLLEFGKGIMKKFQGKSPDPSILKLFCVYRRRSRW